MADDIEAFLGFANRLADLSATIVLRHFRTRVAIVDKADLSPVTIADRDSEAAMRAEIGRAFPAHGIIGEELGIERADADYVWVLDPIDGTKSFVTGRPMFGTLIALCRAGRPIMGVIDCPAIGERWSGATGQPALHNGRPTRTAPCAELAQATLYCTSPQMFGAGDLEKFDAVRQRIRFPVYGGDCYAYGLVASGFTDLVVEAGLQVYDWAAIVPVIESAGGAMTDWRSRPFTLPDAKATPNATTTVLAAGDRRMHEAVLAILAT